mmetsp:Transcript_3801/g.10706  ORF Transcript_3801/g.10706 Transcript_3801/m.10706 type:complete len:237 (-) Transcript_3801:421-1131(-)
MQVRSAAVVLAPSAAAGRRSSVISGLRSTWAISPERGPICWGLRTRHSGGREPVVLWSDCARCNASDVLDDSVSCDKIACRQAAGAFLVGGEELGKRLRRRSGVAVSVVTRAAHHLCARLSGGALCCEALPEEVGLEEEAQLAGGDIQLVFLKPLVTALHSYLEVQLSLGQVEAADEGCLHTRPLVRALVNICAYRVEGCSDLQRRCARCDGQRNNGHGSARAGQVEHHAAAHHIV